MKNSALEAYRKFSTCRVHMFLIFKTLSYIRETYRTLNHGHRTDESFFIEGDVTLERIFENPASEALSNFRIFYRFWPILGEEFDFGSP